MTHRRLPCSCAHAVCPAFSIASRMDVPAGTSSVRQLLAKRTVQGVAGAGFLCGRRGESHRYARSGNSTLRRPARTHPAWVPVRNSSNSSLCLCPQARPPGQAVRPARRPNWKRHCTRAPHKALIAGRNAASWRERAKLKQFDRAFIGHELLQHAPDGCDADTARHKHGMSAVRTKAKLLRGADIFRMAPTRNSSWI